MQQPIDVPAEHGSVLPKRGSPRRIVILGGGFGGLACASALGGGDVDVLLIGRRNHNLFQPRLYQVATAALSPANISEPIRLLCLDPQAGRSCRITRAAAR